MPEDDYPLEHPVWDHLNALLSCECGVSVTEMARRSSLTLRDPLAPGVVLLMVEVET